MITNIEAQLLGLCGRYSTHFDITHWRFSFLARGDGQFFRRLRGGKSCTIKTTRVVLLWFSDHWPEGLEWPSDIPHLVPSASSVSVSAQLDMEAGAAANVMKEVILMHAPRSSNTDSLRLSTTQEQGGVVLFRGRGCDQRAKRKLRTRSI